MSSSEFGIKAARLFFSKRGNHSEVHISEAELAGIFGLGYEMGAERVAELERRMLHMATTNSDDWRWYHNQASQACRALGLSQPELSFD